MAECTTDWSDSIGHADLNTPVTPPHSDRRPGDKIAFDLEQFLQHPPLVERLQKDASGILDDKSNDHSIIAALHLHVLRCGERMEGNCLCTLNNWRRRRPLKDEQGKTLHWATTGVDASTKLGDSQHRLIPIVPLRSKGSKSNRSNKEGFESSRQDHSFDIGSADGSLPYFSIQMGEKQRVRENLFRVALQVDSILEVGFNAGHSAAVFLYAWAQQRGWGKSTSDNWDRAPLHRSSAKRYVAADICGHAYTRPCFDCLAESYKGYVHMQMIEGDSTKTLERWDSDAKRSQKEAFSTSPLVQDCEDEVRAPLMSQGSARASKFDLIHIDGGHAASIARQDIVNCARFAHEESRLLIDDAEFPDLRKLILELVERRFLEEVEFEEFGLKRTRAHRMFRYAMEDVVSH